MKKEHQECYAGAREDDVADHQMPGMIWPVVR